MFKLVLYRGLLAGMLVFITTLTAQAAESAANETWDFNAAIYLWGAGIGGTTVAGDDIDVSFSDILDNLDMTFMGVLDARKGKWSLLADVIYLNLGR